MANEIVVLKLEVGTDGQIKGIKKLEDTVKKSGESSGEKFSSGFATSIKGFAGVALKVGALLTSALGAISFAKSIKNAQIQEDAINSLNTSLLITGKYTKQASQDFQDYASSLQSITTYGDEAILKTGALIQQLANLDSQGLKRATKATLDFASAMNMDLQSAGSLVAKAIEGNVGALGRYGLKVKQGATEAETLSNVLTALEGKFGGTAQSKINTFSGAMSQATNTFGDLLEEIGFLIIKQPLVIDGIKIVNETFQKAIVAVKDFAKTFSLFDDVIEPLFRFADALNTYLVAPIELAVNIAKFSFDKMAEGFSALIAVIGQGGGALATALNSFGVDNAFTQGLQTFKESSNETFVEMANQANSSFQSILDFPISEGLATKNAEILEQIRIRNEELKTSNDDLKNNILNSSNEVTNGVVQDIANLNLGFAQFKIGFDNTATTIANTSKQLAQQFKAGLVNGISGGIQNIVNSIANGENAFKNFGKFVLQVMGDMAIQMGQTLIGAGIGIESLKALGGSAAIVAGAGLVALGAIMKSMAGGGGSSSSAGGASADNYANQAGPVTPTTLSEPDDIEQRNVGPRVQLVVQGDILDSDQTANRILDLLNKNFSDSGGSFNGASFA